MTINGFGYDSGVRLLKSLVEDASKAKSVEFEESKSENYGLLIQVKVHNQDGTISQWFIRE